MYKAPRAQNTRNTEKTVLELRGNPYPALSNRHANNRLLIQNILLDAAKYDYRQSKYAEMAENIGKQVENKNEGSELKENNER